MSHTLHRRECPGPLPGDFVVLMMAAKGHNDIGAARQLGEFLRLADSCGAINLGDMRQGGLLAGSRLEELISGVSDASIVHAVFSSLEATEDFVRRLWLGEPGLSVVVTGPIKEIEALCKRIGLRAAPHTVAFSLGVAGKTELLPRPEILQITTMCGHGLVSSRLVEKAVEEVRNNQQTPESAARMISRPCVCGIFNSHRAAALLAGLAGVSEPGCGGPAEHISPSTSDAPQSQYPDVGP